MERSAFRACPASYGEIFRLRISVPADGTKLAARKGLVDFDQSLSLSLKLILEETREHPPSIIRDRFPEMQAL